MPVIIGDGSTVAPTSATGAAGAMLAAGSVGAGGRRRFALLRAALRFGRTRVGLVIVVAVVLLALLGPLVAPHSPTAFLSAPYASPSGQLLFGGDVLGHDVLSRFLDGGLYILIVALLATTIGVGAGTALGLLAGYTRGAWDELIMRLMDALLCIPAIVLALLFMSMLGPKSWLIVLSVAITHMPQSARVMRGAAVQLTGQDFVKYAETIGVKKRRILLRELLPNVTAPLTVEIGLRMTYSIAIVASLGFLGFGRQPPAADWGLMINENRGGVTIQPWPVVLPVIAIALVTIGNNLIADGLGRAAAGIDRQIDVTEAA